MGSVLSSITSCFLCITTHAQSARPDLKAGIMERSSGSGKMQPRFRVYGADVYCPSYTTISGGNACVFDSVGLVPMNGTTAHARDSNDDGLPLPLADWSNREFLTGGASERQQTRIRTNCQNALSLLSVLHAPRADSALSNSCVPFIRNLRTIKSNFTSKPSCLRVSWYWALNETRHQMSAGDRPTKPPTIWQNKPDPFDD